MTVSVTPLGVISPPERRPEKETSMIILSSRVHTYARPAVKPGGQVWGIRPIREP